MAWNDHSSETTLSQINNNSLSLNTADTQKVVASICDKGGSLNTSTSTSTHSGIGARHKDGSMMIGVDHQKTVQTSITFTVNSGIKDDDDF